MKKGFLRTFIVLGLFSIFACGSFEIVSANSVAPVNYAQVGVPSTANNAPRANGLEENFVEDAIQTFLMGILIYGSKLVAWVVQLAGTLFDYVIAYTTTYPANLSQGIYASWKIIRDFSNIILVFSLLYLGIKTIYDGQGFAEKKTLAGIIIAAVLINFSFFFVKDVAFNLSNTVGLQILEQARVNSSNNSYSAGLMQMVNPQQVLAMYGFGQVQSNGAIWNWDARSVAINSNGSWDLIFRMTGTFMMFTAIVACLGIIFVGTALMLLYRFFIFVILMIASPFGLISTQIPWLKKYGTDWFTQLKTQTIFFPAFTLILYIVLYIVTTIAASNTTSVNLANISTGSAALQFIFNFILIIGFLIGLLILPSKLGAAGSDLMTSSSQYLQGKVRNLKNVPRRAGQLGGQAVVGSTARVGRFAGGKVGNLVTDNKTLKKWATNPDSKLGGIARGTIRKGEALKNTTFDLRNTKVGASLGMGKGIEGWNAAVKAKKEKLEKRKKEEDKLFGFDKIAESDMNKDNIAIAEGKRAEQEAIVRDKKEVLKQAQIAHNQATANGGTATAQQIAALQQARLEHDKQKEELEKHELAVGKLKNLGDLKYIELMKRRRGRVWNRASRTQKEAVEKLEKELEKKWKRDGQSSGRKKERADRARNERDSNPPPTPPPPTP